jgi:hypothetical protein
MKTGKRIPMIPLLAATLLALSACAASPPPAPPEPVAGGACDASRAQFAVGQQPGVAVLDQARERAGARLVRTLRPGQPVTMEYNAERLNLNLDASGKVVRVTCG